MKPILYIFLAVSALMSFQPKNTQLTDNPGGDSIFIKDSSDYSKTFLASMVKDGMKNVALVDSFIIFGGRDTARFPQLPTIGKETVLTAKKGELAIALTIKRINQTTIDYRIEMVEFGNLSVNYTGKADLISRFYLGAEIDASSLSGFAYGATEFHDFQDSCYTYIRLGEEPESGPYLLGKLKKNCNGNIIDIGLFNFPTLVEK